jgi:cytochrome c2
MNFAGLKKVQDRANLVLFLRDQSENPVPLP